MLQLLRPKRQTHHPFRAESPRMGPPRKSAGTEAGGIRAIVKNRDNYRNSYADEEQSAVRLSVKV